MKNETFDLIFEILTILLAGLILLFNLALKVAPVAALIAIAYWLFTH